MYISFYIDDEFYSGEATPINKELETIFQLDLGEDLQFFLSMSEDGKWESQDFTNLDIISATGSEIERHEEAFEAEPLQPGKYSSLNFSR